MALLTVHNSKIKPSSKLTDQPATSAFVRARSRSWTSVCDLASPSNRGAPEALLRGCCRHNKLYTINGRTLVMATPLWLAHFFAMILKENILKASTQSGSIFFCYFATVRRRAVTTFLAIA